MLFSTTSVAFLTLLTSALASPLSSLFSTVEARAPTEHFYQSRIVNKTNDKGSFKGKLWLSFYHTGAGLSDAVLVANKSEAVKGYLNSTIQQFDLGDKLPWYMVMTEDSNYAAWEPVQINDFGGVNGFSVNATGLQWNTTSDGFGGWLACDWFHNVPQLFYLYSYMNATIPVSCSKIDLIEVPV